MWLRNVLFFIFSLLCIEKVSANHYIGVRGGAGISMVFFTPNQNQKMIVLPIHTGVVYKYYPTLQPSDFIKGWERYVGLQVELNFMQKGYTFKDTLSKKHFSNFIELPILTHGRIPLGNRVDLNLMGGLYIGRYLHTTESYEYKGEQTSHPIKYVFNNGWEYGVGGGLGVTVKMNRIHIMWDVRFMSSLSFLYKQELTLYNSVSQVLYSGIIIMYDFSKRTPL